ncbi:MAG: V-type ATP synthase subunit I [Thermoplasmata archaeon]
MLKPEKMVEVILIGEKEKMKGYIDALHELAILHIRDNPSADRIFTPGIPEKEAGKHSELLVKLRILQERLKMEKGKVSEKKDEVEIQKQLDKIETIIHGSALSLLENTERKQRIQNEIEEIMKRYRDIENIRQLGLELGDLMPYENLKVIVGYCEKEDLQRIMGITKAKWYIAGKKNPVVCIVFPKEAEKEIRESLPPLFREINLGEIFNYPKEFGKITSFEGLGSAYLKKINELREEVEKIDTHIQEALKRHRESLLATEEFLTIQVAKEEIPQKMLVGEIAFLIEGWVPESEIRNLEKISKRYGVTVIPVENCEEKPTKLANPKPAKSFELLTKMYSLPKSDELDPSSILWITFPIFFGLIIGDIGYGIMLCILALYLRNHRIIDIGGRQVGNVLMYAGISTIIFGIIFGEILGLPFVAHGENETSLSHLLGVEVGYHGIVNKFADVGFLIVATLIAGYLHLVFAFCLGMYNEYSHGNYRHIIGKAGWIVVLTGFFVGTMRLFAKIPLPFSTYYIMGAICGTGICFVIAGEGFASAFEFLSVFSNLLSYIRLFAVGVAKAGIAVAMNALVVPAFFTRYGFLAVLGFFLIHFLLLLLGILSAGLQSLRLHYVEFFTKFYEGGGFSYTPFGYRRIYTKRGGENGS